MVKQCKGKDLSKVPASKLLETGWLSSIKYDGNYVQIHKQGNDVRFFTSGNKEFYHELAADELVKNNIGKDFILEAEYIADTFGKLGDRTAAAKLTTYRTNFEKGIANIGLKSHADTFKVFDVIVEGKEFLDRLDWITNNFSGGNLVHSVQFTFTNTLEDLQKQARNIAQQGYEGIFAKHKTHKYEPGKRVNTAIKLKHRPTADLKCINIIPGEGKYLGKIGALTLMDTRGRIVCVGSGLSDFERGLHESNYVGEIIEIEYEQILDTYIQPTYVQIRKDKCESD